MDPTEAFLKGNYHRVSLLAGSVAEEGQLFVYSNFKRPVTQNVGFSSIDDFYRIIWIRLPLSSATMLKPSLTNIRLLVTVLFPSIASIHIVADARPVLSNLIRDYVFFCPLRRVLHDMLSNTDNKPMHVYQVPTASIHLNISTLILLHGMDGARVTGTLSFYRYNP